MFGQPLRKKMNGFNLLLCFSNINKIHSTLIFRPKILFNQFSTVNVDKTVKGFWGCFQHIQSEMGGTA